MNAHDFVVNLDRLATMHPHAQVEVEIELQSGTRVRAKVDGFAVAMEDKRKLLVKAHDPFQYTPANGA